MPRPSYTTAVTLALLAATAWGGADPPPARKQLRTLPPAPKQGRFPMSYERVWPEKAGQAHVCLWADDKYAAVSIPIDDNCQPDHDWWIAQGAKHGFRFTWFVITDAIHLSLSDDMDDALFDCPLTSKARVPDGWAGEAATQGGALAKCALVEHGGGRFALVAAVPGRGAIRLTGT